MKRIPVRHISNAQREESNTGRFSIRTVQQVLNGKDLVQDLHRHDFFFVLALQKGEGFHTIDFVQYEVHDFSIFVIRPGQVHKLELTADASGFLMEFDAAFYQPKNTISLQLFKKASGTNYCDVEAGSFIKLSTILNNLLLEFTTKQEGYIEAIRANLSLFFIEYIRQSRNSKYIVQTQNGYTQERFEELCLLLEERICSIKSVAQYADLLSLSTYQLNAVTKASVGKTVSDLINEQIALEAKRYLLATNEQVKEIADHLGYEDVSYFIRFFRKQTGQSPEAFRKYFK